MNKQIFVVLAFSLFVFACKNEAADKAAENQGSEELTGTAALAARAVEESDYLGRVRMSLTKIQEVYTQAEGKMPGMGKVTLSIDDNYNLIIENKNGGDIVRTEVNLKNLNPEDGGMMLIPDTKPGEFPGLRMIVLEGKPGVSISKNGKLEKEDRFLDIYMPSRPDIEAIAPVFSSMLNAINSGS
ncbi:MAG: hypothetical protein RI973_1401 [Bacteroidota bacterium]|jgi:hypothetical protein